MSYIRYKIEKQQVSYDSGVTWVDTSVTRKGEYVGTYSTLSECETGGDTSYSGQYFTIESLVDNNVVKFNSHASRTVSVSTNGGFTWTEYTASDGIQPTIATLNTGQKAIIKGMNSTYYDYVGGNPSGYPSYFWTSGRYIVYGNIMSLIYGDSFRTENTLTGNRNFMGFFGSSNENLNTANLISVANLVLPATVLTNHCYDVMFGNCKSITEAPVLPATTLAEYCYSYMFQDCTSLTTAPELPATTLAANCYYSMFRDCTSLNSVTCQATDISARLCTYSWLRGVAASGTFVKAASMTEWGTGSSGIPEGWTVQNA